MQHLKQTLLLLVISISVSLSAFAGRSGIVNTDSLEKALAGSPDTTKIHILLDLSSAYEGVSPERSIQTAEEAIALSGKIHAYHLHAESLDQLGSVYNGMGDYEKALSCFLKSYEWFEKDGRKQAMSNVSNSIGNVYTGLHDLPKALDAFQRSYDIATEINDAHMIAVASIGLGNTYNEQGDLEKALKYFTTARAEFEKKGAKYPLSISIASIASVHESAKEYDAALASYNQALSIAREIDQRYVMAMCMKGIASVYRKQEKYQDALKVLNDAVELSRQANAMDNTKEMYRDIAEVYKLMRDYESSLQYYEKYSQLKDSLFTAESARSMNEMQARYDTERKEREIQLKDAELDRQKVFTWSIAGGLALVLGLAFMTYNGYRQKRKANVLLAGQNQEIQLQKAIIEEKNRGIMDSIRYAERIQQALFPAAAQIAELLPESFIFYRPKDIVSGDFYWVEQKGNKVFFAAVDCTGHGVPGAFMSIVGYNGLNQAVNEYMLTRPGEVLDHLNKSVKEVLGRREDKTTVMDGMDIALCSYDKATKRLEFAGALSSLYIVRSGMLNEVKGDKLSIAANHGSGNNFTTHSIEVQVGDCLYLFSDGFADQFGGPQGKKYKYSQLKQLLAGIGHFTMQEQARMVEQAFDGWRGGLEQVDDVLLFGIKI